MKAVFFHLEGIRPEGSEAFFDVLGSFGLQVETCSVVSNQYSFYYYPRKELPPEWERGEPLPPILDDAALAEQHSRVCEALAGAGIALYSGACVEALGVGRLRAEFPTVLFSCYETHGYIDADDTPSYGGRFITEHNSDFMAGNFWEFGARLKQHRAELDLSLSHVFVSYVREDSATVDRLALFLRARGIPVWLDRSEIQPGERWQVAIRRAIQDGSAFVACFSSAYAERSKSYMNEELTLAIGELRQRANDRTWFFPVTLDQCTVPDISISTAESLTDFQSIRFVDDWQSSCDLLAGALLRRITAEGVHKT